MNNKFLPVFAVNRKNLLNKLQEIDGDFGILATFVESDNFLTIMRQQNKPYFLDSGVFNQNAYPWRTNSGNAWYTQIDCIFKDGRWLKSLNLATRESLQEKIRIFLDRCDKFSPDYVFAPDIIGEPLLSLHLARITIEEYIKRPRSYILIGVVQAGHSLYNWEADEFYRQKLILPHYQSPKSFLSSLISEYRAIGYRYIALGGLLKADKTMPMGLKFGLSNNQLDSLLSWSRPEFVLGGLALSRLEVLRKHKVWADSSNWLWWTPKYDNQRFSSKNTLKEVIEAGKSHLD